MKYRNYVLAEENRRIDALNRVLELVVLLDHDMTRSLANDGLTTSRAHALMEIVSRGPCTQRALADALEVSARNVTGLVDGLVETGFVTREPHPTDRRATLVTLTAKGKRIATKLLREQDEFADLLFADLSPANLAAFITGLDHVVAKLNEHGLDMAATRKEPE